MKRARDAEIGDLVVPATERLLSIHRGQVRRDPWPDFARFDRRAYSADLRRAAAVQWAGRARAEHGSVHQFSAITHALTEARAPLDVLGALARLVTDEVRHAELCADMALVCWKERRDEPIEFFRWPTPRAPWGDAPRPSQGESDGDGIEPILAWAADAVIAACCIGETLSRPMLEAIATVATDPIAEGIARQILRDEHLHATFGFEVLGWIWPRLGAESRATVQRGLAGRFAGVERATTCGIRIEELAGTELAIEPGVEPNLGTLTDRQYAAIFYATMEREVIPRLTAAGLDALGAWHTRPRE